MTDLAAGKSRFSYSVVCKPMFICPIVVKILLWFSDTLLIRAKNLYNANDFF